MWVCRAAALMVLKQNDLARSAVDRVIDSRVDDPLLPADEAAAVGTGRTAAQINCGSLIWLLRQYSRCTGRTG